MEVSNFLGINAQMKENIHFYIESRLKNKEYSEGIFTWAS